jgi:murein DD-endopeptidase MepM/ murein hydrolase activator NlpD
MKIKYSLLAGILAFNLLPINSLASSSNEIRSKINNYEQQAKEANTKKSELNTKLNDIQTTISETLKKVETSQNKIIDIENKITILQNEMKFLKEKIVLKEEEIRLKQIEIDEMKVRVGQTLSFLYENKDVSFVEFFFQTGNLDEILNSMDFLKTIADENDILYKEVQLQEKLLQKEKTDLNEQKNTIEKKISETNLLKKDLEKEKEVLEGLLKQQKIQESLVIDEIFKAEALAASAASSIIASTHELEELAREEERKAQLLREEEEKKNKKNSINSISIPKFLAPSAYSSSLINPMRAGTYTFTSHYGIRIHPIFKTSRLHSGFDLAGPVGTPIYAAGSGKVIYAGSAQGYGNLIVILHSNNLYTLYAHMYSNSILVSSGQNVTAGQQIGGVGSAGNSTGPHLHFSVAEGHNGSGYNFVNPINYVSP